MTLLTIDIHILIIPNPSTSTSKSRWKSVKIFCWPLLNQFTSCAGLLLIGESEINRNSRVPGNPQNRMTPPKHSMRIRPNSYLILSNSYQKLIKLLSTFHSNLSIIFHWHILTILSNPLNCLIQFLSKPYQSPIRCRLASDQNPISILSKRWSTTDQYPIKTLSKTYQNLINTFFEFDHYMLQ